MDAVTTVRLLVAGLFALHGIAHLVGFVAPWRLVELSEMPYKTTVLGGTIDLGDRGIRGIGVAWLVVALGFMGAAVGVLSGDAWWWRLALGTAILSLGLTALEWPAARVGLVLDLILIAALLTDARLGWIPI